MGFRPIRARTGSHLYYKFNETTTLTFNKHVLVHASPIISVTPRPQYVEKSENGGFTLKTHQMFSVHNTPVEFENAPITDDKNA